MAESVKAGIESGESIIKVNVAGTLIILDDCVWIRGGSFQPDAFWAEGVL